MFPCRSQYQNMLLIGKFGIGNGRDQFNYGTTLAAFSAARETRGCSQLGPCLLPLIVKAFLLNTIISSAITFVLLLRVTNGGGTTIRGYCRKLVFCASSTAAVSIIVSTSSSCPFENSFPRDE